LLRRIFLMRENLLFQSIARRREAAMPRFAIIRILPKA
jgi:hypothetical protein